MSKNGIIIQRVSGVWKMVMEPQDMSVGEQEEGLFQNLRAEKKSEV
jgi:hypothetical protein